VSLEVAVEDVARSERELAELLLRVGERHHAEHDVAHMTRTLGRWCEEHLERLGRPVADLEPGPLSAVRERASELVGRAAAPGLALLADLRAVHLKAAEVSVNWTVLGQGAQAARDEQLLATVAACHPETLRQMRWALTRLKDAAPQVLTS
jgi:hypothetical protein